MSYVRLADRYAPVTIEQRVFLVDDDVFELEGASAAVGDALVSLKAGCKTSDIEAALGAEGSVLIKTLREHGMLRNRPISTSEHYQSRQIGLLDDLGDPTTLQQRFARSQIAIIGCGGIGAVAAQHLVGAGACKVAVRKSSAGFGSVGEHCSSRSSSLLLACALPTHQQAVLRKSVSKVVEIGELELPSPRNTK